MQKDTREAFSQLLSRIAELNGVRDATQTFNVTPSVQQSLETHIQESSAFLRRINITGVDEARGQRLKLGITGPIAKRTNVEVSDREPSDISSLEEVGYTCESTEFDTHITWAKLDAWAKFPDFQRRVRDVLVRQQALDRISIGFNGVSAAAATNPVANPLLDDVNKGWLQLLREQAPSRVLAEGGTAGEVRVGPGGDYENLDALIFDVVGEMIDPWHRDSTGLEVIAGRSLIADKYFQMASKHGDTPTEALAADVVMSNARFGGLPAARVPAMPQSSLFITMPENLSIYWQRGKRRRFIIDNPKRNRVENYESSNEAYMIEDFGAAALVENIVFGSWS